MGLKGLMGSARLEPNKLIKQLKPIKPLKQSQ